VSKITLISDDGDDKWGVYGRKVFGHPVNTDGYFDYKLSGMIDSGQYYTQLVTADGDMVEGDVFTINPKEDTADVVNDLQDRLEELQEHLNNS